MGTFYAEEQGDQQAGLRVATSLPGNTGIYLSDRNSCKKQSSKKWVLGWFHHWKGQAYRRGYDKRIGLEGGNIYKDHMYAEYHVNLEPQPRIFIENVSGAIADLNFCGGHFDLDIEVNKNYEIFVDDTCSVMAYELTGKGSGFERRKVEMQKVCL